MSDTPRTPQTREAQLERQLAVANERIATLKAALVIAAKDAQELQLSDLKWERKAKAAKRPITTRKAFVCAGCGFVYCDEPVTSCDCMMDPPQWVEGMIAYPRAVPAYSKSPECQAEDAADAKAEDFRERMNDPQGEH